MAAFTGLRSKLGRKTGVLVAASAAVATSLAAAPAHATTSWFSTIVNDGSNKCIEVYHSETTNYANVDQYTCNGSDTQQWMFVSEGYNSNSLELFEIVNNNSGKCLDVYDGGTANYTNVDQYTCNRTGAQLWYFGGSNPSSDPGHGISLVLINNGSGKALDVQGGSKANYGNIDIYQDNESDAQFFSY
ncbi:hypothetical protein ABH926_004866 [Catenulispora sp. GP43]|uniref:RICIN domain-containing protein n=1 Tax=Catenulispora sp. GP43 TaxID=3156263 RepID=UPI0035114D98